MKSFRACLLLIVLVSISGFSFADEAASTEKKAEKPAWAKKSILDYSDADMERLLEQWDENDEEKDDDPSEKPPPPPKFDLSKIGTPDAESMIRASKKGRTVMMFVALKSPSREVTETITGIWQTGMQNNHLIASRFLIENDRAIFMFNDGDHAWDAKDFLIQQPECQEVTIEGQSYYGPAYEKKEENPADNPPPEFPDSGEAADPLSAKTEL